MEMIPFPNFSDYERDAFNYGDCWRLARAIHDLSGWPMAAIVPDMEDDSPMEDEDYDWLEWGHILVQTPCGRYVDINGIHDADALISDWNDCIVEDSVEDVQQARIQNGIMASGWELLVNQQTPAYNFSPQGMVMVAQRVIEAYETAVC